MRFRRDHHAAWTKRGQATFERACANPVVGRRHAGAAGEVPHCLGEVVIN